MTPGLRLPGAGGPVFSRLVLKILAVLLITLLLALAYNGPDRSKWFFWHPFFALLAVLPLSTGGIFLNVYNAALKGGTKNSTTTSGRPAEQRIPNVFHNVSMIAATVCMWVAFYVIYTNKELNAKPHLTSWHSWIGVTVLLGYTGASLPAVLALWDYPLKMPSKVVSMNWIYGNAIDYSDVFSLIAPKFETQVLRRYGWMLPDTFAIFLGHGGHKALEDVVQARFAKTNQQIQNKGGAGHWIRNNLDQYPKVIKTDVDRLYNPGEQVQEIGLLSVYDEQLQALREVLASDETRSSSPHVVDDQELQIKDHDELLPPLLEKIQHELLREAARRSLVNDFFLGYFQRTESGNEQSLYSVAAERKQNFGWGAQADTYWLRLMGPADTVADQGASFERRVLEEINKLAKAWRPGVDASIARRGGTEEERNVFDEDDKDRRQEEAAASSFRAPASLDSVHCDVSRDSSDGNRKKCLLDRLLRIIEFADIGRKLWGGSTEGLSPEALEASVLSVSFRAQASMIHNTGTLLCLNNHGLLETDPQRVIRDARKMLEKQDQQDVGALNMLDKAAGGAAGEDETSSTTTTPLHGTERVASGGAGDNDHDNSTGKQLSFFEKAAHRQSDVSASLYPELFRQLRLYGSSAASRRFVDRHFRGLQQELRNSREAVCHATASVMEETRVTADFLRFLFEPETKGSLPRRFLREHGTEIANLPAEYRQHSRVTFFQDEMMRVDMFFAEGLLLQAKLLSKWGFRRFGEFDGGRIVTQSRTRKTASSSEEEQQGTTRTSLAEIQAQYPWRLESVSGAQFKVNYRNATTLSRAQWERECTRRSSQDDRFFLTNFDEVVSGLSTFNLWYSVENAQRTMRKKLLRSYPAVAKLRHFEEVARAAGAGAASSTIQDLGERGEVLAAARTAGAAASRGSATSRNGMKKIRVLNFSEKELARLTNQSVKDVNEKKQLGVLDAYNIWRAYRRVAPLVFRQKHVLDLSYSTRENLIVYANDIDVGDIEAAGGEDQDVAENSGKNRQEGFVGGRGIPVILREDGSATFEDMGKETLKRMGANTELMLGFPNFVVHRVVQRDRRFFDLLKLLRKQGVVWEDMNSPEERDFVFGDLELRVEKIQELQSTRLLRVFEDDVLYQMPANPMQLQASSMSDIHVTFLRLAAVEREAGLISGNPERGSTKGYMLMLCDGTSPSSDGKWLLMAAIAMAAVMSVVGVVSGGSSISFARSQNELISASSHTDSRISGESSFSRLEAMTSSRTSENVYVLRSRCVNYRIWFWCCACVVVFGGRDGVSVLHYGETRCLDLGLVADPGSTQRNLGRLLFEELKSTPIVAAGTKREAGGEGKREASRGLWSWQRYVEAEKLGAGTEGAAAKGTRTARQQMNNKATQTASSSRQSTAESSVCGVERLFGEDFDRFKGVYPPLKWDKVLYKYMQDRYVRPALENAYDFDRSTSSETRNRRRVLDYNDPWTKSAVSSVVSEKEKKRRQQQADEVVDEEQESGTTRALRRNWVVNFGAADGECGYLYSWNHDLANCLLVGSVFNNWPVNHNSTTSQYHTVWTTTSSNTNSSNTNVTFLPPRAVPSVPVFNMSGLVVDADPINRRKLRQEFARNHN
eukprot:g14941.t1